MATPLSNIKLLANVDIKSDYKNSFTFPSAGTQSSFFSGKAVNTRGNLSYIRKENVIRYDGVADDLYNISYLMYQNLDYGSKWFYAFVTDVKYINDNVTHISFEIDVIQTWYFEMSIRDSYVEREHVADDGYWKNLVDENLNTGDFITRSYEQTTDINELIYIIASTKMYDELPSPPTPIIDAVGREYAGVYSGLAYIGFDNVLDLNLFLFNAEVGGYGGATQNIFVMPRNLINGFTNDWNIPAGDTNKLNYLHAKNFTDIDGYFPKNNKLFNYPYNFLYVSSQGQVGIFKYEYGSDPQMNFEITSNLQANPTVYLTPKNYKGTSLNYDETLALSNYPLCAWTDDIYRNWLAQNVVSNPLSVISSTLALGVGVATANPIAIAGGAIGVANTIGGFVEKSIQPNQARGSQSGGGNVALGTQTFNVFAKTIDSQHAKIIDDYFTKFGYRVNELKTPSLQTRINWNYIKLRESNIFGNLNNKDLEKINSIFETGITFWHNDNVGNYNRSNDTL